MLVILEELWSRKWPEMLLVNQLLKLYLEIRSHASLMKLQEFWNMVEELIHLETQRRIQLDLWEYGSRNKIFQD